MAAADREERARGGWGRGGGRVEGEGIGHRPTQPLILLAILCSEYSIWYIVYTATIHVYHRVYRLLLACTNDSRLRSDVIYLNHVRVQITARSRGYFVYAPVYLVHMHLFVRWAYKM